MTLGGGPWFKTSSFQRDFRQMTYFISFNWNFDNFFNFRLFMVNKQCSFFWWRILLIRKWKPTALFFFAIYWDPSLPFWALSSLFFSESCFRISGFQNQEVFVWVLQHNTMYLSLPSDSFPLPCVFKQDCIMT